MFGILERFDIALAHGHQRHGTRQEIVWRQPIPQGFPQLNGGVILYRTSDDVKAFLESWREAYHTAGFKWDQITLRELLWLSDLRLYVLPPEYNVRYKKYLEIGTRTKPAPRSCTSRNSMMPRPRCPMWRGAPTTAWGRGPVAPSRPCARG